MKKKNLIPLVIFSVVFLGYSIYFVKVINTTKQLEPDSIAKTINRVIEEKRAQDEQELKAVPAQNGSANEVTTLKEPLTKYVNYTWLNVRKKPTLASSVVEKILKGDEVQVLDFSSSSWAYVKTKSGSMGYVAKRYLSDAPVTGKQVPPTVSTGTVVIRQPEPVPVIAEPAPVAVTAPLVVSTPVAPVVTTPSKPTEKMKIYDIPVISYHHISNDVEMFPDSMVLPEVNFFAQLDYLVSKGYKTYTFFDLERAGVDDKAVIITFNGGYADAYTASQHLNGKGLKGVFFISTDKIGKEGYLDWRQVKKMRSWGMEIGSQGVTGALLTSTGDYYINDEIVGSKKVIEEQLGEKIISYSYALGGYNAKIIQVVKDAGYKYAKTAEGGSRYSDQEFYTLPTLRVFFPAGAKQFMAWLE